MNYRHLTPLFAVSPQVNEADIEYAARLGFCVIICNRPDQEEPAQSPAQEIAAYAACYGIAFRHVPVVSGSIGDADIALMRKVIDECDGPILAYCRTGTRSAMLWALSNAGRLPLSTLVNRTAAVGYDISTLTARLTTGAATDSAKFKAPPSC